MFLMKLVRMAALVAVAAALHAQDPSSVEAVVTTDAGTFRMEFAPEKAPKHVAQFLKFAKEGYYDGSAFFRMIAGGIIQGGDPGLKTAKTPRNLWGTGGLNLLPDEFSDMKHESGVVSAVRIPGRSGSDGAQFFVCVAAQPSLDGQYSAFGRITEGMDVISKISEAMVAADGFAATPIKIQKVTIEPKRADVFSSAPVEQLKRTVTLKTSVGVLKLETRPEWAPETVRAFLRLTRAGWYNGTSFHRISKGFVAQGGLGETRSSGRFHAADRFVKPLKGEFREDVKHERGIVSMAHGDDPDSGTTSFFLMLGPAAHLDGKFSAFAKVVEGLEVLDAIEKEELDGETPKRRIELITAAVD